MADGLREALTALHHPYSCTDNPWDRVQERCSSDEQAWPCDTAALLAEHPPVETATEWLAVDLWDSGVEEAAYQGHSEADAREMEGDVLRRREVTAWEVVDA